jgi:hypothetical protein
VWRAANGINPQDPRPTGGGGQLETLPALWKQRLDRDIAWATYPPAGARADERQAARTALIPSRAEGPVESKAIGTCKGRVLVESSSGRSRLLPWAGRLTQLDAGRASGRR